MSKICFFHTKKKLIVSRKTELEDVLQFVVFLFYMFVLYDSLTSYVHFLHIQICLCVYGSVAKLITQHAEP
jgi:hypothetical protein